MNMPLPSEGCDSAASGALRVGQASIAPLIERVTYEHSAPF